MRSKMERWDVEKNTHVWRTKTRRGVPVGICSGFPAHCGVGLGIVQTRRCGSSAKGLGMP
jgi:hypothetical protein